MEFLAALWAPVLVAAVLVFVVSSIVHMVLPLHKADCHRLPGEEEVLAVMRRHAPPPGEYMFPFCDSMKAVGSKEMAEKYREGPVGFLAVLPPGPPAVGRSLVQWFLYILVVGVFVAYLTWHALAPGAPYLEVFRIAGTGAFLAYGVASVTGSIWKGVPWRTSWKYVLDGLVYSLVTAGAFGWLWPAAA